MRYVILIVIVLGSFTLALAREGDNRAPLKPELQFQPAVVGERTGGEFIQDAVSIPGLPYVDEGNTCGAADDYDAACPYVSTSPDLFYSFYVETDMFLTVDLCGSSYDTKTYVLDADLNVLACSDDFYGSDDPCGAWVSKIPYVFLTGGQTVWIGVDGWGGECGAYIITVTDDYVPCEVVCPPSAMPEGEPPLAPDQLDGYNTGCNADPPVFQHLWGEGNNQVDICGSSGWYRFGEYYYRDTDWFQIYVGPSGELSATIEAGEYLSCPTQLIFMGPGLPDPCLDRIVYIYAIAEPCVPTTISMTGTPGQEIWVTIAPNSFLPEEAQEYEYYLTISGVVDDPVAGEVSSWSRIKALYQ